MPDRSSEGEEIKVVTLRGKGYVMTGSGSDYTTYEGPNLTADDNYHTFEELYEHRHVLFIALLKQIHEHYKFTLTASHDTWCSKLHADGTMHEGHFIAGIGTAPGAQISYHLPLRFLPEVLQWALYRERAPEYDGYTSRDVLERLRKI